MRPGRGSVALLCDLAALSNLHLVLLAMVLLSSTTCISQVVDPIAAQRQPVPGAGHDYVGTGTEMVNPADGSLSFNLPIKTPAGRQLSIPFGINFNSTEPFHLMTDPSSQASTASIGWTTSILNRQPEPFSINGWSYALPMYQAQATASSPSSDSYGNPNYCWSTSDFTFRGFDGLLLPISITSQWPDNRNSSNNGQCPQTTYPNGGSGAYALRAIMGEPPQGTVGVQPPLAVTDREGTLYNFSTGPSISTNPSAVSGGLTPFGLLAQTVTDRNGNQVSLNGTSVYVYGNTLGSGSYTDTAGRTAVAWSGLGDTQGDHITLAGLSTDIIVKWTTTSVTLPQSVAINYGSACSISSNFPLSMSVVSEIDLPNGTKYSFGYGGTWGLLNRVTLPSGGYIRYEWGTNPASEVTRQTWSGGQCNAVIDAPAVTDRYVSYDGVSETLHQTFSDYSTSWVVYNDVSPYWTLRKTTVTDYERSGSDWSKMSVKKYQYTPGIYSGPGGPPVPLESSIAYQDGSGNTLQTVNKSWIDPYVMVGVQTVLDNGQGMTTLRCPDQYENITAVYV